MLRRISKTSFIRADLRELERLRKDLYELFDEVKEDFLSSGDYELRSGGYLLRIERKSVDSDLLNSIRSGLLSEELRHILNEADIPIWLKEGDMTLRRLASLQGGDPMHIYNAIDNASISAQLAGIIVINSPAPNRTAERLKSVYEYFEKDEHRMMLTVKRLDVPIILFDKEYNQTIALLMGLPGIGQELAERLLKHFGSIESILTAPEEELQKVEGIGSGKAKAIKEFISKRWSEVSNSER